MANLAKWNFIAFQMRFRVDSLPGSYEDRVVRSGQHLSIMISILVIVIFNKVHRMILRFLQSTRNVMICRMHGEFASN
jgi:hypothetical protein